MNPGPLLACGLAVTQIKETRLHLVGFTARPDVPRMPPPRCAIFGSV